MQKNNITRRNFLKLSSLMTLRLFYSSQISEKNLFCDNSHESLPNIIILVLDSLSAKHLSLYGYLRNTSPNLEKFSQQANVYHAHYSAGNFTTPGTASLLTGTYPWTHRAINDRGLILRKRTSHNIFAEIGEVYNRLAYSQNPLADYLLQQFTKNIDKYINPFKYNLLSPSISGRKLENDQPTGTRILDDFLLSNNGLSGGTYLSFFNRLALLLQHHHLLNNYRSAYPFGIPHVYGDSHYFLIESIFDGIIGEITSLDHPFLGYFHLYPPHYPYYYRQDFVNIFSDNLKPVSKPLRPLSHTNIADESLDISLQRYDEYIANIDFEFGRPYSSLVKQGILDNCYFIITSDHGELFERGIHGHWTPLLYQDVINIPLLISVPGQKERKDYYLT